MLVLGLVRDPRLSRTLFVTNQHALEAALIPGETALDIADQSVVKVLENSRLFLEILILEKNQGSGQHHKV